MVTYGIREIEQLTGVSAHALRKWELRYGFLSRRRTSTNIRYYTNEDLRRVLKVKLLLTQGMKISHLSHYSLEKLNSHVIKAATVTSDEITFRQSCLDELLLSAMDFDETGFNKTWKRAVAQLGVLRTMTEVIYPLLNRVGLFWVTEKMNPAQEHFLSCLVRRKLLSAIDELKPKMNASSRWLLFLHEEEDHEIPLLFAHYLLQKNGANVIYLGARVPFENLKQSVVAAKPTHLLTFITTRQHDNRLKEFITKVAKDLPKQIFFIGGSEVHLNSIRMPASVKNLSSPDALIDEVNRIKKSMVKHEQ